MTDERMPPPGDDATREPADSAPRSLSERGPGETRRPEDAGAAVPEPSRSLSERGTSETKRPQDADASGPEDADDSAPEAADNASRSLSERGTSETKRPEDANGSGPEPAPLDRDPPKPPTVPRPPDPTVTTVSPDVDLAQDASPLPGAHRGGFQRLPTAPVAVTLESAPGEPGGDFDPDAAPWEATDSAFHRGLAGWALAFAVVGLSVSLFVGWGFPIGLVAVVCAIIALRRPLESRAVAVWAIALGTLSILYSAGWLLYNAMRANLIG